MLEKALPLLAIFLFAGFACTRALKRERDNIETALLLGMALLSWFMVALILFVMGIWVCKFLLGITP